MHHAGFKKSRADNFGTPGRLRNPGIVQLVLHLSSISFNSKPIGGFPIEIETQISKLIKYL